MPGARRVAGIPGALEYSAGEAGTRRRTWVLPRLRPVALEGVLLRLGVFHRQLIAWSERPCALTVSITSIASTLRFTGILRAYYSLNSLRGWALVPPQQHGGFESIRLTDLSIDAATSRVVTGEGEGLRLRYSTDGEIVFTLERDPTFLTAPPRTTREGRYLYVGGRRRPVPEDWMLQ